MSRNGIAWGLTFALLAGTLGLSLLDAGPHAGEVSDGVTGTWKANGTGRDGTIRLSLRAVDGHHSTRITERVPEEDLPGLSRTSWSRFAGTQEFSWRTDPGVFTFTGRGRWWRAFGEFTFTPNPRFAAGVVEVSHRAPDALAMLQLALSDSSTALVAALATEGYRDLAAGELVRLTHHSIGPDYVRGMQSLGYRPAPDELVRLRNYGFRTRTAREYARRGLQGIPVEDLVRFHTRGIGPAFVAGMVQAGYTQGDVEDLTRLHAHGLSVSFVTGLRAVDGFGLSTEELIRLGQHGVDAPYLQGIAESNLSSRDVADVIRLRQHGVSPAYVAAVAELGYAAPEEILRLDSHGIGAQWLAELHRLGRDQLTVDEAVRLHNHGITAAFVRRAHEAGHAGASVEELIRLQNRDLIS